MKKTILIFIFFTSIIYANNLKIKITEVLVIGNDKLILSNVKSLAQDQEGHLYIPESKFKKVYKISPEGKLIFSFGTKGVGPGDIRSLNNIYISEKNEIVISESAFYVSFFDLNGKFLRKYTLNQNGQNRIWYLKYIGNNHVIGKKFVGDTPTLLMVKLSKNPKIVNSNVLTGDIVPVYKNQIRFHNKEFVPELIYSNSSNYTAIAKSNEYNIKLVNNKGIIAYRIKRNLKKPLISRKEKAYIVKKYIKPLKVASTFKNGLERMIPAEKNYINNLSISNQYIFVERIKADITQEEALVPVDVFRINGEFLGQIKLKSLPLLITQKFCYFLDNDEEGNIIIKKYLFDLIFSES